jgi:hypothetical protein
VCDTTGERLIYIFRLRRNLGPMAKKANFPTNRILFPLLKIVLVCTDDPMMLTTCSRKSSWKSLA